MAKILPAWAVRSWPDVLLTKTEKTRPFLIAAVVFLSACGGGGESRAPRSENVATAKAPHAPELSEPDQVRVCRTAIADMNGRSPNIVRAGPAERGVVQLRYTRPTDGTLWTYDCRIEGDRVIWRSVDLAGRGSGPGRWRTDPLDGVITYSLAERRVTMTTTYPDGPPASATYEVR